MHGTTWLMWLGVALAMAAVEAVTVDLVFIMIALGALAGGITSFFGGSFLVSSIVAVGVALGLLVTLRPAIRRRLRGTTRDNSDIGSGSVVGMSGYVVEPVSGTDGLVKVRGELWSARSESGQAFNIGDEVRVVALVGATLEVQGMREAHVSVLKGE